MYTSTLQYSVEATQVKFFSSPALVSRTLPPENSTMQILAFKLQSQVANIEMGENLVQRYFHYICIPCFLLRSQSNIHGPFIASLQHPYKADIETTGNQDSLHHVNSQLVWKNHKDDTLSQPIW